MRKPDWMSYFLGGIITWIFYVIVCGSTYSLLNWLINGRWPLVSYAWAAIILAPFIALIARAQWRDELRRLATIEEPDMDDEAVVMEIAMRAWQTGKPVVVYRNGDGHVHFDDIPAK